MDNQDQPTPAQPESVTPQPAAVPTPAPVAGPASEPSKPRLDVPIEAAQALLTIDGLGSSQKPRFKLPRTLIITLVVLIILAILSSAVLGKAKSATPSNSKGSGTSSQSGSSDSKSTENQINQDVNSCSDPVNAVSEC